MADIRNPFNPMRFTGKNGMLTVEEASRLQDLIKNQAGTFIRNINDVLNAFDVAVTNVQTTPGAQGLAGIPGFDGADGEQGFPGPAGARGVDGAAGRPGADGLDGDEGPVGPPGAAGAAGSTGATGPPGAAIRGAPGDDGEDGDRGPPGRDGAGGAPGTRGPPGQDGEDASEAFIIPRAPATDQVSFHFFVDYTTPVGAVAGKLVPSSQSPISAYGAAEIPYPPSVRKTYVRGELIVYIVNNNLVGGETYNFQVLVNGASTASSSTVQFTSGSSGVLSAEFLTGSTAPLDRYSVQVGGAAVSRIVTYTVVLRLFES